MEITAKTKDTNGVTLEATGTKEEGANLEAAVKLYGEDYVFNAYKANFKIDAQDLIRRTMVANGNVQEALDKWVPGTKAPRASVDPIQAAFAVLAAMPPDEARAKLAALKGAIKS